MRVLIVEDETAALEALKGMLYEYDSQIEVVGITEGVKLAHNLNEGVVTGIGTHEELLKNNNEYQEIYYSQMDKEEVTA